MTTLALALLVAGLGALAGYLIGRTVAAVIADKFDRRRRMKQKYWKAHQLVLCRSDQGDGGWSLHAPWATDQQIADGDAPYLASGEAEFDGADWSRPNETDYQQALNVLSARDKCQ